MITETRNTANCDRFGEKFFLRETKGRTDVGAFENLPKPPGLVRRFEKGVIAIDGRVGLIGDIVNLANGAVGSFADSLHVWRGKKQAVRVDVPIVDEPFGFLRAAAWVARVHESALVIHELIKVAAGAGQGLPEVVGRYLHDFAADGVADADDFPEGEDQALAAIETEKHARGAGDLGFFH